MSACLKVNNFSFRQRNSVKTPKRFPPVVLLRLLFYLNPSFLRVNVMMGSGVQSKHSPCFLTEESEQ